MRSSVTRWRTCWGSCSTPRPRPHWRCPSAALSRANTRYTHSSRQRDPSALSPSGGAWQAVVGKVHEHAMVRHEAAGAGLSFVLQAPLGRLLETQNKRRGQLLCEHNRGPKSRVITPAILILPHATCFACAQTRTVANAPCAKLREMKSTTRKINEQTRHQQQQQRYR